MENTFEILIDLLHQAQENRNTIWTFYVIIITTAFGIAFTDSYRSLDRWVKIMLSLAVGASVWYNFFALVGNSIHIYELVTLIKTHIDHSDPLALIFSHARRYGGSNLEIHLVYIPVNLAIGAAMWWIEIEELWYRYVRKAS